MKFRNFDEIKFNASSFMSNVFHLFGLKWIGKYNPKWYDECIHFGVQLVDIPLNVSRVGF